jgi:hypothetical protein
VPLRDPHGRKWSRNAHLISEEIRNGVVIKICPPRHAAGALVWPQKLNKGAA